MKIKDISITFDEFVNEGGVGAAMFFVLLELIAVNTSSLWYVFGSGWYNAIWAILGALGFSLVTTVVIRKKVPLWLKFSFPVFDMMLVFTGMNITHWGHLLDNPLRLVVTIIFALFTGAVLMALGMINYEEQHNKVSIASIKQELRAAKTEVVGIEEENAELHSDLESSFQASSELQGDYDVIEEENNVLRSKFEIVSVENSNFKREIGDVRSRIELEKESLATLKTDYDKILSALKEYESQMLLLKVSLDKKESKIESMTNEAQQHKARIADMESYETYYLRSEKSRILKKKEDNRTADERKVLAKAEAMV